MKNKKTFALVILLVMLLIALAIPIVRSTLMVINQGTNASAPASEVAKTQGYDLNMLFNLPIQLLIPGLALSFVYLRRTKEKAKQFFRLNSIDGVEFGLITVIAIVMPLLVNFIISSFEPIFGKVEVMQAVAMQADGNAPFAKQLLHFLYVTTSMALMAGICEEFFFRGAVLSLMQRVSNKATVILILNALIFAAFHLNLAQMPYLIVIGLVFTLTAHFTNSVFASMYLHFLYNFFYIMQFALDTKKYTAIGKASDFLTKTNNPLIAVLAAGIIVGLLYVIWMRRRSGVAGVEERSSEAQR